MLGPNIPSKCYHILQYVIKNNNKVKYFHHEQVFVISSAIEEGTSSKVGLSLAGFPQVKKKYLLKILLLSDKLGCKKLCPWMDTIFQVLLI